MASTKVTPKMVNKIYERKLVNFFCMRSNKKPTSTKLTTKENPVVSPAGKQNQAIPAAKPNKVVTEKKSEEAVFKPEKVVKTEEIKKKQEGSLSVPDIAVKIDPSLQNNKTDEAAVAAAKDVSVNKTENEVVPNNETSYGDKDVKTDVCEEKHEVTGSLSEEESSLSAQVELEEQEPVQHIINNVMELDTLSDDAEDEQPCAAQQEPSDEKAEECVDELKPEPVSPSTAVDSSYCFHESSTVSEIAAPTKSEEILPVTEQNDDENKPDATKPVEDMVTKDETEVKIPSRSMFHCCQSSPDPTAELCITETAAA